MLKKILFLFLSIFLLNSAKADTLVLTNGLSLEGKFKGGTDTTIKFETSGTVQEVALSEIKSLTFSAPAAKAEAGGTAATTASAAPAATDRR